MVRSQHGPPDLAIHNKARMELNMKCIKTFWNRKLICCLAKSALPVGGLILIIYASCKLIALDPYSLTSWYILIGIGLFSLVSPQLASITIPGIKIELNRAVFVKLVVACDFISSVYAAIKTVLTGVVTVAGLRVTCVMGSQFRVSLAHRDGMRCLACV